MKRVLLSLALIPIHTLASNGEGPIGSRSAALGHASSCLHDVWSSRNNQGSLGFVKQAVVGAFYENRFFVKELTWRGFAAAIPTPKGTFGLCYSSLGYSLYRESHANLSYGILLAENVSAGVAFDYLNTIISAGYGQANRFTGSAGLTAKITPQIVVATHLFNPFRVNITNDHREKTPAILKLGIQYIFSKQVCVLAEVEKASLQPINIKFGIEYNPSSLMYIRAGAASYPAQTAFGIGVNYHGLKIDMGSMYHSILGLSPQIGLSYAFGKDKSHDRVPMANSSGK